MGDYTVRVCLDSQGFQVVIVGACMVEPPLLTVRAITRDEDAVASVPRAMSAELNKLADLAADGKLQEATAADYCEGA